MKRKTSISAHMLALAVLMTALVTMAGYAHNPDQEPAGEAAVATSAASTTDKRLLTSREAFQIAEPVAVNWSSDAVLVDLSNFRGSSEPDGRAIRWKLEFNSADRNQEFEVHVSAGKILQTMEERYKKRDAVTGDWIDSPEAMKIAHPYFGDEPVRNYWLGLSSHEGTVSWYIKCKHHQGTPIWVQLNALTGEFIKTREGY